MRAPLKSVSDSAFGDIVDGRTHPISPTDPRAIQQMIGWLEKADQKDIRKLRSRLSNRPDSRLPSRLLKIMEGGAEVFLVNTSDETRKYAALSHCWGSVRPMTLSTDSFDQLKNGVPTSSLPQSFQDAVWLTHRLGAQYLWIDSLCIFQDSLQDWTRESAKMCDVYAHSWLTIAASRASSSEQGFLGNQERPDCTYITCKRGSVSEEIRIFALPIDEAHNSWKCADLDGEPLTGRGWTLQERFLPKRVLHFSRSQIMFEHHWNIFAQDRSPIPNLWCEASYGIDRPPVWYRLVEQFSTRRLTKETDKLVAIAGLASYFVPTFSSDEHSTYHAGLWRKDMLAGLCWSIHKHYKPGPRPKSYIAPSWSWAAIDGKVVHKRFPNELAIIEEVQTSLLSLENPFGEVQAGWIRLRAILLCPSTQKASRHAPFWFCQGNGFYDYFTWDSEPCNDTTTNGSADPSEDDTVLQFMPVLWGESDSVEDDPHSGLYCIILKQVNHEVAQHSNLRGFERVGSGLATCSPGVKEDLFKLATDELAEMMLAGQLEEIILV